MSDSLRMKGVGGQGEGSGGSVQQNTRNQSVRRDNNLSAARRASLINGSESRVIASRPTQYGVARCPDFLRRSNGIWGVYGKLQRFSHADPPAIIALPTSHRLIFVPYRWLAVLLAILPVVALIQMLRRRQQNMEFACEKCGNDLSATPERCPECGAFPS